VYVDGVRLAYNEDGAGPAVVCLHAIGHGAGDFAALRERLAGRYRLVALDWPGHGNSDDDREPVSAARYAELLIGFLDAAGIERTVLLGNSIGGAAAIRVAAAHPHRVRALVLCNPGGLDRVDALSGPVTRLMARFFTAGANGAWWYPRAFGLYYRLVLPAAPAQRARIVAAAREVAPVLAQAWRSFGAPDADIRGLGPQITCPVWFAWARGDRINQLTRCQPAIQRFPNARLDLFDGGHAAFLEAPDAFAQAFEQFVRELPAASVATERAGRGLGSSQHDGVIGGEACNA
jgi:4,5:9,10-diseco-3-hydroxy-5,9,17-trioxoandrosta-1(10),2-diene-4-oate hydrolase